ncbi:hypothetical protein LguiA_018530 [Lonicera macranthoides]
MKLPKSFAAFFLFCIWHLISSGNQVAQACTFFVRNECPFPIWPATAPNKGHPIIANGGFYLPPDHLKKFPVPEDWSGRLWARTGCNFAYNWKPACETGDCDSKLECNGSIGLPPVTLLQISLLDDPSFYDISLVDGYNLPVSITTKPYSPKCTISGCVKNLKHMCPQELQVCNEKGEIIACKSACLAFNLDKFCCRNEYRYPDKCKPSVYAHIFKDACPSYISYAYDSLKPVVKCVSDVYVITFCPSKWGDMDVSSIYNQ